MAKTTVRSEQIKDDDVSRADLNTTTPGKAVITKIIAGTNASLSYTGADPGTGEVTIDFTGGGGGPGISDDFAIKIRADDTNTAPTDADSYAMTLAQSDTIDAQTETAELKFPSGVYDDANVAPTDTNNFTLRVWLSGSAGTGVTNPNNANGQNDGAVATLQTQVAGTNPITMTSQIGTNVPAGLTLTNALYRGWFRSANSLVTSTGEIIANSSTGAFADIVLFTNSGLNNTVDHLTGTFTFDLFAAGVNTLAKLQTLRILHRVNDAAAGVTPHVLTVDAGYVQVTGAFS